MSYRELKDKEKFFELASESSSRIFEATIDEDEKQWEKTLCPIIKTCMFLEEQSNNIAIVEYLSLGNCMIKANKIDLLEHVVNNLLTYNLNREQFNEFNQISIKYLNYKISEKNE